MPFLSTLGGGSNKGFSDQGQALFLASGGSVQVYTAGGKTWKSHTFLNSGTFNITSGSNDLEVLIVAGGGGGGADNAGGGGAGGLLYYGTETPKTPNGGALNKSVGSYSVVVGNGGSGHTGPSDGSIGGGARSQNGGDSSVFGYTAIGGGGGVSSDAGAGAAGNGGSGGGNSGNTENPNGGSSASTSSGTSGQGFGGGQGSGAGGGGGGGGAASAGSNGSGATGGNGGNALSYAIRTGSATNYAGGGNGGNENSQYSNNTTNPSGIGGITNLSSGSRPSDGATNTGSGGGGATHVSTMPSGSGGKGIVVIRYVPSVGGGATMAEWQDVPAGVYDIPTTNGAGSMNLEIVELDGRKWAKIPYGTESVTGTWTGQNWVGSYRSLGNWGTVNNGNLYADGSARWTNDNEGSGPNNNAKQVTFNVGISYRYVKVYCTAIQSHTSSGSGAPNCDWGGETGSINIWNLDLSGGYGDHPYWITGWDVSSGTPRYRGISGNTSSGSWISGGSGGWTAAEAGNVTRSFTSGTHDTGGNYVHDRLGLGIAGGASEYYRHNSGYFLIS